MRHEESGMKKQVRAPEAFLPASNEIANAVTTPEGAVANIRGAVAVLREFCEGCSASDLGESLAYLANRLDEHAEAAEEPTGVLFQAVHGKPEDGKEA